jgi:hypothetical protein
VTNIFRKSQSALLAACAAAGLLTAAPAWAINDDGRGGIYESLMDMVGMGEKSDPPPIAYRERSPLVVPPKLDLPDPQQPASQRAAAWPTDQEIVRARKKATENNARGMAKYNESNGGERLSAQEQREMRSAGKPESPVSGPAAGCSMDPFDKSGCSPSEYWSKLAVVPASKDETTLQAGVEPEREYLTQPPKGFLKPTKNVKATFEPNKKDDDDPRSFYWDQAKKQAE